MGTTDGDTDDSGRTGILDSVDCELVSRTETAVDEPLTPLAIGVELFTPMEVAIGCFFGRVDKPSVRTGRGDGAGGRRTLTGVVGPLAYQTGDIARGLDVGRVPQRIGRQPNSTRN